MKRAVSVVLCSVKRLSDAASYSDFCLRSRNPAGTLPGYHFLSGKDRDAIAKELGHAFKLPDAQALKITRRITARVRLYQRVFELMPAKEA